QIISYKTLKSEYKPFEAKRRLMNSFDLFLSDARIRRLLPSHLGKHFYRSKKVPLSVNLQASNLAKELNKYIQGSVLPVTNKGCCYTARIGHTGMKADEIVENVMAAAEVIAKKLPKNWKNVKILHLKTAKSIALPIFTAQISKLDELDREPLVDKQEEKKKRVKKPKKAGEKMTSSEVAVTTETNAAAANQEPVVKEKAELAEEPDDDDGEIPQLVPIDKTTSVTQRKKMEPNESLEKGGKLGKKTKTRLGKRKNPFPQETPKTKHKVTAEQASLPVSPKQKQAKQLNTPKEAIKKKELKKKTPKKPEAKFFATPKAGKQVQSAKKASKTPK
ncbi:RL1D1 protein, partial [Nothocercus julius]|nr:RL1D1 protein [Nothocercus julius]